MILVNALGAHETGARLVAINLAKSYVFDERAVFVVSETAEDFPVNKKNMIFINLSHKFWGRYFRLLYELIINIFLLLRIFRLHINLSHYGLVLFGKHRVYVHNPQFVEENSDWGFSPGKMNFIKKYLFKTCINRADRIYVQTKHMYDSVMRLMQREGRSEEFLIIIKPKIVVPRVDVSEEKKFNFQLFYPTSDFEHKRSDLAIKGTKESRKSLDSVGLIITSDGCDTDCVLQIGRISHSEALELMSTSDALLFTSEKETLGLPLHEALLLHKPAVLPDLAYAREVYGEAGVYYKEFSAESIAKAILQLRSNYDNILNNVSLRCDQTENQYIEWVDHWRIFTST